MATKRNIFERVPVLQAWFYTAITLGTYFSFWFYGRSEAFAKLESKKSGRYPVGLARVSVVASLISTVLVVVGLLWSHWGSEDWLVSLGILMAINQLMNLLAAISWLVLSFRARKILGLYYKIEIDGILTLFFGVLYLQYKINRIGLSSKRKSKKVSRVALKPR
jgi:hypothetical protein